MSTACGSSVSPSSYMYRNTVLNQSVCIFSEDCCLLLTNVSSSRSSLSSSSSSSASPSSFFLSSVFYQGCKKIHFTCTSISYRLQGKLRNNNNNNFKTKALKMNVLHMLNNSCTLHVHQTSDKCVDELFEH